MIPSCAQSARVLAATMQDARFRWWSGEVDSFGSRVDAFSARVDAAIARIDAIQQERPL